MEYNFLTLIDKFAADGYVIYDELLNANDLNLIISYFEERLVEFKSAQIGRGKEKVLNQNIRSDLNLWVENSDLKLSSYFKQIEFFHQILKKEFFLPIKRYETQLAYYPKGAAYAKHKDRHTNTDARIVSSVFYLNKNWTLNDGGQLRIYTDNQTVDIEPIANRLIVFRSELEHEVLTSHANRKSLTTWFRNDE